jgi:hypothetical protein
VQYNYRIRRLHLSRLLLVQPARHPSPRIIRTFGKFMRAYLVPLLLLAVSCRGEDSPTTTGAAATIAAQERRIELLEDRIEHLEFQVRILRGEIVLIDGQYKVRPGDSAARIAFNFEIPLMDLMALNPGQSWTTLKVGQLIRVAPRKLPNQLPDPTSPSVTPPAGTGGAPSVAADH